MKNLRFAVAITFLLGLIGKPGFTAPAPKPAAPKPTPAAVNKPVQNNGVHAMQVNQAKSDPKKGIVLFQPPKPVVKPVEPPKPVVKPPVTPPKPVVVKPARSEE